jgi:hypothetical protein
MTRSELIRRKRQMQRRIWEVVMERRLAMSQVPAQAGAEQAPPAASRPSGARTG